MNDYPNDGGAFIPKEDPVLTEAAKVAEQKLNATLPYLDDLIDWFDEQIDFARDVNNIQTAVLSVNGSIYESRVSIEGQVLAQQKLRELLEQKKTEYVDFKRRQDDSK